MELPKEPIASLRSADNSFGSAQGRCGELYPHCSFRLLSEEEVCGDEEGEDHRNYAIHREKSGVEFTEIVGFYERVFVEQEQHDCDDASERKFAQGEGWNEHDEKDQHDEMEGARDPKSGADADVARNRVESGVTIKFEILTGVKDVEAGDPEGNGGGEEQDARVEGAADGDPGGGWGNPESEAENEMGKAGEALGIGIKQQNGECDGREPEREAIQLPSGQDKNGAGNDDKSGDKGGRKMSGGKSASAGTGVRGVDGGVGEAVEGHGGGASGQHGDDDPEKLMGGGKPRSSEHGSAESEREREDGVLPLDHFECDAKVVKDGHRKIVRQFWVVRLENHRLLSDASACAAPSDG